MIPAVAREHLLQQRISQVAQQRYLRREARIPFWLSADRDTIARAVRRRNLRAHRFAATPRI
jgi:hypothetical protein